MLKPEQNFFHKFLLYIFFQDISKCFIIYFKLNFPVCYSGDSENLPIILRLTRRIIVQINSPSKPPAQEPSPVSAALPPGADYSETSFLSCFSGALSPWLFSCQDISKSFSEFPVDDCTALTIAFLTPKTMHLLCESIVSIP